MSAIVGMLRLDGSRVDPMELIGMTGRLMHRGTADHWIEGSAALGQIEHEQALVHTYRSHVIAADVRIDNRYELTGKLGLRNVQIDDARLIAAAYERWGQSCVDHLLGDFAFAIWDEQQQLFFCARDQMGVRPFYYFRSHNFFAFATEIKALLALEEVDPEINDARIADYLMPLLEDHEATFYHDILRLPAAHCMTISRDGVRIRRYWELDPEREIRYNSDEEYAEAFREIFTEAVRCRLDQSGSTGSMLSGGLDSSSIACTARELLTDDTRMLHTFSARFPSTPQCDEGRFINAVVKGEGLRHHNVDVDSIGPLSVAAGAFASLDEPLYGPNTFLNSALYDAARKAGVRVILDGTDGDTTVSHGITFLNELARSGRWLRLGREIRGVAQNLQLPVRTVLWRRGIKPLVPSTIRGWYRAFRGGDELPWTSIGVASEELARQTYVQARAIEFLRDRIEPPQTAREFHLRGLRSALLPLTMEELNNVSALYGVEPRYPFFDRRLVEFCLALPGDQKIHHGWTRMIMRRGMEGILPEEIRWRRGKGDLSMNFCRGLLDRDGRMAGNLIDGHGRQFSRYINLGEVKRLQADYSTSRRPSSDAVKIWRAATMIQWLRRTPSQQSVGTEVGRPAILETV
jgi:asparagine synthase (glutamine-hydrolysing)